MKSLWRAGCLGKLSALIVGSITALLAITLVYWLAILAIRTWAVIGIPIAIGLGLVFYFFLPVRLWFSRKFPQFAEQIVLKKSPVAVGLSTVLTLSSLVAMQASAALPAARTTTPSPARIAVSLPTPQAVATIVVPTQVSATSAPKAVALMQVIPTVVEPTASAVPTLLAPTPTLLQPATAAAEQVPVQSTVVPTEVPVEVSLTPRVTAPQNVNLRSGPGQNYPVVNAIPAGVTVDVVGRNEDATWLLVNMNEVQAWVSQQVVSTEGQMELVAIAPAPPAPVEPIQPAVVQAEPTVAVVDAGPAPVVAQPDPSIAVVDAAPAPVEPVVIADPPTVAPAAPVGLIAQPSNGCEPAYPDICIPIGSPDLNCPDLEQYGEIRVVIHPDPHGLDRDKDGVACAGD